MLIWTVIAILACLAYIAHEETYQGLNDDDSWGDK